MFNLNKIDILVHRKCKETAQDSPPVSIKGHTSTITFKTIQHSTKMDKT